MQFMTADRHRLRSQMHEIYKFQFKIYIPKFDRNLVKQVKDPSKVVDYLGRDWPIQLWVTSSLI